MSAERHAITATVNGTRHSRRVESRLLLSDFLRHELGLTGTRVGCEHGVCGACTILYDGLPARSCLMFAAQAHGHAITTIEGLAPGCIRCRRRSARRTACSAATARRAS
jgi:carbon-monoxide dehydrogenase small subunit